MRESNQGDNVKKSILLSMTVILATLIVSFAESQNGECDAGKCVHQWETMDFSHYNTVVEQEVGDDERHWLGHYGSHETCSICGELNDYYRVSASGQSHAFDVISCKAFEGDEVEILFCCRMCEYERSERTTIQTIVDGTAETCLLGGACPRNIVGFMNDKGIILPDSMVGVPTNYDIGERVWFNAVIYDADNRTFLFSSRDYCPVCGRPRIFAPSYATPVFNENWNGLPIMTEEYFLTVDMPENLPYQLIDQLRKEAGGA